MGHVFWRWTRLANVCPALDRRRSLELRRSQPPEDPPAYGLNTGHTWMPEVEMSFLMRAAFGGRCAGSCWSDHEVTPSKQTAGRPVPNWHTVKPSALLVDRT